MKKKTPPSKAVKNGGDNLRKDLFTHGRVNIAIRLTAGGRRQQGAEFLAQHNVPIDVALRTLTKPKKSRTRNPPK